MEETYSIPGASDGVGDDGVEEGLVDVADGPGGVVA